MPTRPEEQIYTRTRSVVSRVVGGETLIVPVRGKVGDLASIYSFNGTGTLIWQLLDTPRTLIELVEAVEHEYAVATEKAQNDVKQFLNDMLSVELVAATPAIAAEPDMAGIDMNAADSTRQSMIETSATN